MPTGEIAERAAAIRLPIKELASLAGLNKHTAYRAVSGSHDSLGSTRDRLQAALEQEERKVLAHLLGLYGGAQ